MAVEVVETESKHPVHDLDGLLERVAALGCPEPAPVTHTDEYYDTADGRLGSEDFVVRLRISGSSGVAVGFKGPRSFGPDGTYTRIEVELPGGDLVELRAALARQGLVRVWRLEKRRRECVPEPDFVIAIDELPVLGLFVELEGEPERIAAIVRRLGPTIGPPDPRNYHELLIERWVASGRDASTCTGAAFDDAW